MIISDKKGKGNDSIPDKIVSLAREFLNDMGFSPSRADIWNRLLVLGIILLIAFVFYMILNKVIVKLIHFLFKKLRLPWENYLYQHNFFNHVLGIIPPIIVLTLLPIAFNSAYSGWIKVITIIINIYIVILFAHILISFIHSVYDYH